MTQAHLFVALEAEEKACRDMRALLTSDLASVELLRAAVDGMRSGPRLAMTQLIGELETLGRAFAAAERRERLAMARPLVGRELACAAD